MNCAEVLRCVMASFATDPSGQSRFLTTSADLLLLGTGWVSCLVLFGWLLASAHCCYVVTASAEKGEFL